eukprot:TRINITY_DN5151_c0_g1_i1.p1 TRINITY_DN5151_c0_g1~~TRINITY_DN5151_c0_g1_i1.p1  ORF type:complete len:374 (-),score=133.14 TRINITY_DN5151_c0_g1_i1:63-1184(-)
MGRKRKTLKACDPFCKDKERQEAFFQHKKVKGGYNQPVTSKDDTPSRSMQMFKQLLQQSAPKQKTTKSKKSTKRLKQAHNISDASTSSSASSSSTSSISSPSSSSVSSSSSSSSSSKQKKIIIKTQPIAGEHYDSYLRRLHQERKQLLSEEATVQLKKPNEKRKAYLKLKKQKKKGITQDDKELRLLGFNLDAAEDEDNDSGVLFQSKAAERRKKARERELQKIRDKHGKKGSNKNEKESGEEDELDALRRKRDEIKLLEQKLAGVEKVPFGVQADRPPIFQLAPQAQREKRAQEKAARKRRAQLSAEEKGEEEDELEQAKKAEQEEMTKARTLLLQRQRAMEAYAQNKSKRRSSSTLDELSSNSSSDSIDSI